VRKSHPLLNLLRKEGVKQRPVEEGVKSGVKDVGGKKKLKEVEERKIVKEQLPNLTSIDYWDSRYRSETACEWLADWAQLRPSIEKCLGGNTEARILEVGCGTSSLAWHMWRAGYRHAVHTDLSPVCISTMAAQHPHLAFLQRDLTDLQFREGQFDLVLEKSTLDTLLSDCPDQEQT